MADNRYLQMRAMVLAAVRTAQAAQSGDAGANSKVTPASVLEDIIVGRFETELSEGKTLISVNEANGAHSFAIIGGMTPADIVELAMESLVWLNSQPDPLNPQVIPAKRIKRLRASFKNATI